MHLVGWADPALQDPKGCPVIPAPSDTLVPRDPQGTGGFQETSGTTDPEVIKTYIIEKH